MWHTICISLPSLTREQQHTFDRQLRLALRDYDTEVDTIDIGLFFLRYMRPDETALILEERRALVQRNLIRVHDESRARTEEEYTDIVQQIIREHIRVMLRAELEWIESTLKRLRALHSA
ncbi:hypothetical protein [Ktedonobacter robiniae]|uniref:Uncharacterized protein n=1 Tax=Ktedonobacter robiniae TaxID=2778365 RepID=A0ABQ3UU39_9CHLR|nr:hypothetical protein [Ktedonobacter robiniae]GHO55885.1 hypothetical protein KSB_43600 [Ktedonobacter robiniae]